MTVQNRESTWDVSLYYFLDMNICVEPHHDHYRLTVSIDRLIK